MTVMTQQGDIIQYSIIKLYIVMAGQITCSCGDTIVYIQTQTYLVSAVDKSLVIFPRDQQCPLTELWEYDCVQSCKSQA